MLTDSEKHGGLTMLCVWDQKGVIYYKLLKPGETINIERYDNKWSIWIKLCVKNDRNIKKSNSKWFCFMIMHITHSKTDQGNDWDIWLGNTFACSLLGSVRLPLICIDGTRTCSAVLHFLRRCTKMARWLVWLKRITIFLAWHPQIVKQAEKMYSYWWAILRIKYFLSFSCNKRVFSIKKFGFHIYIPGIMSNNQ